MKIFTEAKISGLTLRNRIIRSGCFEGMCPDSSPSDELTEHHRKVAAGGAAMTTVAYCSVSKDGRAFGHEMWMRKEIIPALRKLTDAVHSEGAAASIQLGHCGFFSDKSVIGTRPIGPSRKFCTYRLGFSRAADNDDLKRLQDDFVEAAILAKESGFDAIEVHGGHGYLLSQFLSPWTNKRRDEYGGILENRMRFPLEIVRALRQKLGAQFPIIVKMNIEDGFRGGLEIDESIEIAKGFEKAGASALVPSCGFTAKTPLYMLRGDVPVRQFVRNQKNLLFKTALFLFGHILVQKYRFEETFLLEKAKRIKDSVSIPVMLIGGVMSLSNMQRAMDEGFEFVQAGRAIIKDPDIISKMKKGELLASDCDHCNRCVGEIDAGPVRCITNEEQELSLRGKK